jgi:hypothetical protein
MPQNAFPSLGIFHPHYLEATSKWGTFRIIWLIVFVCSTFYAFGWDVCMDWDLGYTNSRPPYLRELRLFSETRVLHYRILPV